MEPIVRAAAIFLGLVIFFRIAGTRTLMQMTSFDFVLLLIISEATQNAMLGNDYSLTNGFLVILTLVSLDILLSFIKQQFPVVEHWLDGLPMVIVEHGKPLKHLMSRARVDEADVLSAARESQGLERMEQIKYAVLENNGSISIIPKSS
jgi:uncharacterized membrane protein YcaP (DUF421 family)